MHPNTMKSLGVAAAAAAIALAGCATGSAPPPPAASGGSQSGYVDMGLAAKASAFESFTRQASGIAPGFANPSGVGQALQTGAAYEPKQLEAGMIAFAALAALQEPGFVAGLRKGQARDLARRIAANPEAAIDLPGGSAAAARANAALHRRGEALNGAGQGVKKAAYTVQKQGWSKARVPNAAARLAGVKRIAANGYRPAEGDTGRLFVAVSEGGKRSGASPVVTRAVAVAALEVLGQESQARALMNEPRSGMCLRMAKLNYHQCLAAAGTHYEDIYCLGVHAMMETGQCVSDATRPARSVRRASTS